MFGYHVLLEFFKDMNVKMIIRAHECVNGYKFCIRHSVLTLFSSSNYGTAKNPAGYAHVDQDLNVHCVQLPPLEAIKANEINYHNVTYLQSRPQNVIPNCVSCRMFNSPSRYGRRLSNASAVRKFPSVCNTTIDIVHRRVFPVLPIPTRTNPRSSRF